MAAKTAVIKKKTTGATGPARAAQQAQNRQNRATKVAMDKRDGSFKPTRKK